MANADKAIPQQSTQTMFAGMDVRWMMDRQAEARADHPFLVWAPFTGDDKSWTYKEFRDEAHQVAAGLYGRGVRAGDFVLLHFDNCPEILIAWYACAVLGAVGVTTNARSSGPELTYFAENSSAVAAITQPKFAKLVRDNCPALKWVVVTDNDNGDAPKDGTTPDAADAFTSLYGD
ncbi:MAG: AMP-binding protein, partial [Alphaproteobacteria bacterium]